MPYQDIGQTVMLLCHENRYLFLTRGIDDDICIRREPMIKIMRKFLCIVRFTRTYHSNEKTSLLLIDILTHGDDVQLMFCHSTGYGRDQSNRILTFYKN